MGGASLPFLRDTISQQTPCASSSCSLSARSPALIPEPCLEDFVGLFPSTGSYYVMVAAWLELIICSRLTSDSHRSASVCLPAAGMEDMGHHTLQITIILPGNKDDVHLESSTLAERLNNFHMERTF